MIMHIAVGGFLLMLAHVYLYIKTGVVDLGNFLKLLTKPLTWTFDGLKLWREGKEAVKPMEEPYKYQVTYVQNDARAALATQPELPPSESLTYEQFRTPIYDQEKMGLEYVYRDFPGKEAYTNLVAADRNWFAADDLLKDHVEPCPCCEPDPEAIVEDYIGEKIYHIGDTYFAAYVTDDGTLMLRDIDTFTAEDFEPVKPKKKAKKKDKKHAKSSTKSGKFKPAKRSGSKKRAGKGY